MALRETPLSIRFGPRRQGMNTVQMMWRLTILFSFLHTSLGSRRFLAEIKQMINTFIFLILSSCWLFTRVSIYNSYIILKSLLVRADVLKFCTLHCDNEGYIDAGSRRRVGCLNELHTPHEPSQLLNGSVLKFSLLPLLCRSSKAYP